MLYEYNCIRRERIIIGRERELEVGELLTKVPIVACGGGGGGGGGEGGADSNFCWSGLDPSSIQPPPQREFPLLGNSRDMTHNRTSQIYTEYTTKNYILKLVKTSTESILLAILKGREIFVICLIHHS